MDTCDNVMICSWYMEAVVWCCVLFVDDVCGGIIYWGVCEGNMLTWCDVGGVNIRICGECAEFCVLNDKWGYWCVLSSCSDLLFMGECLGNSVRWCNRDGEVEMRDCSQYGQSCSWIDVGTGYWCE